MESQTDPNIRNRWDRLKRLGLAEAALLYVESLKQQRAQGSVPGPKGPSQEQAKHGPGSPPPPTRAALFLPGS